MTPPKACPWCQEKVQIEPDYVLGRFYCATCGRLFRVTDYPIPRMDDAKPPVVTEERRTA